MDPPETRYARVPFSGSAQYDAMGRQILPPVTVNKILTIGAQRTLCRMWW